MPTVKNKDRCTLELVAHAALKKYKPMVEEDMLIGNHEQRGLPCTLFNIAANQNYS